MQQDPRPHNLVLSRKAGQAVEITVAGQVVRVWVQDLKRQRVNLRVEAPECVIVKRCEL